MTLANRQHASNPATDGARVRSAGCWLLLFRQDRHCRSHACHTIFLVPLRLRHSLRQDFMIAVFVIHHAIQIASLDHDHEDRDGLAVSLPLSRLITKISPRWNRHCGLLMIRNHGRARSVAKKAADNRHADPRPTRSSRRECSCV